MLRTGWRRTMSAVDTPRIEEGAWYPDELRHVLVAFGVDPDRRYFGEADNVPTVFSTRNGLDLAVLSDLDYYFDEHETTFEESNVFGHPFILRGLRVQLEASNNDLYTAFRDTHALTLKVTSEAQLATRSIDLVHAVGGDTVIRDASEWPAGARVELVVHRNRWGGKEHSKGTLKLRVALLGVEVAVTEEKPEE
jgi:hypothetical protein